ncbi:hypothetical protein CVT26_007438, partial [Gymnopilus dilepis]
EPPSNPAATAARRRTPSPPGLSRSPSPFRASEQPSGLEGVQNQQRSESPARLNVTTERGRAMHMTAPPSYSREPSPAPGHAESVSRSNSTTAVKMVDWRARSRSRDPTPVRGGSVDLPIRRLPSIPPPTSSASSSRPSTPPQGLGQAQPLPQPPVKGQAQAPSTAVPNRLARALPVHRHLHAFQHNIQHLFHFLLHLIHNNKDENMLNFNSNSPVVPPIIRRLAPCVGALAADGPADEE